MAGERIVIDVSNFISDHNEIERALRWAKLNNIGEDVDLQEIIKMYQNRNKAEGKGCTSRY